MSREGELSFFRSRLTVDALAIGGVNNAKEFPPHQGRKAASERTTRWRLGFVISAMPRLLEWLANLPFAAIIRNLARVIRQSLIYKS